MIIEDKKILKVLIIDDAFFIRTIIKKSILNKPNDNLCYTFEVSDEAIDGKEGIIKYFKHKPDIITLDIGMPELNGVEVAKQILSKDSDAKIIVITGNTDEAIENDIKSLGAVGYVKKPFKNEELWDKLDYIAGDIINGCKTVDVPEIITKNHLSNQIKDECEDKDLIYGKNLTDKKTEMIFKPMSIIPGDGEDCLLSCNEEYIKNAKIDNSDMAEKTQVVVSENERTESNNTNHENNSDQDNEDKGLVFDMAFDIDKELPETSEITYKQNAISNCTEEVSQDFIKILNESEDKSNKVPEIIQINDNNRLNTGKTFEDELNNIDRYYNSLSNKENGLKNEDINNRRASIAPPRSKILKEIYADVIENQYKFIHPDETVEETVEGKEVMKKSSKGFISSVKKLFNKK